MHASTHSLTCLSTALYLPIYLPPLGIFAQVTGTHTCLSPPRCAGLEVTWCVLFVLECSAVCVVPRDMSEVTP